MLGKEKLIEKITVQGKAVGVTQVGLVAKSRR